MLFVPFAFAVDLADQSFVVGCVDAIALRSATPGSTVSLFSSASAEVGSFPRQLRGVCLDLDARVSTVGSARVGRNGSATVSYTPMTEGVVLVQAVERASGATTLSNIVTFTTYPQANDSDGDGLTNLEECALGTDPFHADTEGGWVDGRRGGG